MPPPNRAQVAAAIRDRLKELTQDPKVRLLPWTHEIPKNKNVNCEEWEEYHQRRELHEQADHEYAAGFRQPRPETAQAIWWLLGSSLPKEIDLSALLPAYTKDDWFSKDPASRAYAEEVTKQAFLILLETFVSAGLDDRMVTLNDAFDALAARFSDHFRSVPAKTAWDMTRATVKCCRRDILLNGISLPNLWNLMLVDSWSWKRGKKKNPLFYRKRVEQRGYQVFLREQSDKLSRFYDILRSDTHFSGHGRQPWHLLLASRDVPPRRDEHELCADDARYNEVTLSPRSEKLLELQEAARLLFDKQAFQEDYERASDEEKGLRREIEKTYRVNPRRSTLPARVFEKPDKPREKEKMEGFEKWRRVYEPGEGSRVAVRHERETWSPRDKDLFCRAIEKGLGEKTRPDDGVLEAACRKALEKDPGKWEWHRKTYQDWFDEEYGYSPEVSVKDVVKAAKLTEEWRREARDLLARYDRPHTIMVQYHEVNEQVTALAVMEGAIRGPRGRRPARPKSSRYLPIRTGFYRTVNRRYQPTHVWPTFVTAKDPKRGETPAVPEGQNQSFRNRWFRASGPDGKECELVGYDVSSSQTQIMAILLGLDELHKKMLTEEKSIKVLLAEEAWRRHTDSADPFNLSESPDPYLGPDDERLRELVGTLWMRVLYGSPIRQVVEDQRDDRGRYGPGWKVDTADKNASKNAKRLLESKEFQSYYKALKQFLRVCRRVARAAHDRNRCAGVELRDPFDDAAFCWNPVERHRQNVDSAGQKILVNVPGTHALSIQERALLFRPGEPRARDDGTRRYPVDPAALKKMLAPCLVHMLDAAFSSLVMEKLAEWKVRDFVGIHDCWLVPEKVRVDGRDENGREVLRRAIEEAAAPWFKGLGSIYKDLAKYLVGTEFEERVTSLKARWEERLRKGDMPTFLIRES